MLVIPDITSSYRRTDNSIGESLYNLVMELKPKKIIEFGVMHGYSAICMAQALRDLGEGHLYAYDHWSPVYKKEDAERNVANADLNRYITIDTQDFTHWLSNKEDFDLLHVDIDNSGTVIKVLEEHFPTKHVIFEGGIKDRDDIKPDRVPIIGSASFEVINSTFPGLSKLIDVI